MTLFTINIASPSKQETEKLLQHLRCFIIDEIRKCMNNYDMEATFRNALKEIGPGVLGPLTEQDVMGIIEIMKLEWSISNAAPNVRAICGDLSDEAIRTMTAPYKTLEDCDNTARFFFLEKLRREGAIVDWGFIWTDNTRVGDLFITPKEPIPYISSVVKL